MSDPIPMRIPCPECCNLHIDEGEFATKPHHTHSCQSCGLTWRPAVVHTVGVRFLPGFKNEAKGEPQAAEPPYTNENEIDAVERYDARRAAQAAEPPAKCGQCGSDYIIGPDRAEPPEPRPIVVDTDWVPFVSAKRDPEPAAPSPELPRKVEAGTTLTVGARYRITEITVWDDSPEHSVGDEFVANGRNCRIVVGRFCNSKLRWVVNEGTMVTGLELVADAPAKEQK